MSLEKEAEYLRKLVKSVVIIPSTADVQPAVFTNEIFETQESRNSFFEHHFEKLNNDCEIIISAANYKMHAHNFDGVYRFEYITVDDVTHLLLSTPVGVDVLLTKHFQEFLNAVNEWFLEGEYEDE